MFSKKHRNNQTTVILLIGLMAFIFCQGHPAIGDEHAPAAGAGESCQISALPSAVITAPILAVADKISGHTDGFLDLFSGLNFQWVFSDQVTGKAGPLVRPFSTAKRYQLTCTYRL
jgi:hypothetical protein